MSEIRPFPIGTDDNAFLNKVGGSVNSLQQKTRTDFQSVPHKTPRKDPATNRGMLDPTQEYFPNDIAIVDGTVAYTDYNGNPLTIPSGSYVCTNHIPAAINSSSFFLSVVVPAFNNAGATTNNTMANAYRWYQYNNYYPTTQSFSSSIILDGSGYNIIASQSFWKPLGGSGGGGTTAAPSNFNFRGIYTPTPSSSYNMNDAVMYQQGVLSGLYFSTVNGNNISPSSGIGWIQLSGLGGSVWN